jgi:hypothetical protein
MNKIKRDPSDSWAEVELFRWQYGELPKGGSDNRKLDVSEGLIGMAKAIEKHLTNKEFDKLPTPFNVCEVLKYCARQFHS